MEVIINNKTFTLLPLNKERREMFCEIICNPPKIDEKNQKRYLYAILQNEETNWFKKIFKYKTYVKEKKGGLKTISKGKKKK